METGESVAAIVTGLAVAVALVLGIMSLCQTRIISKMSLAQTRDIQQMRYRQEQLNEIIAWAIDIAKCEAESDIRTMPPIKNVGLWDLMFRYGVINARSGYVATIASEFGGDVQVDTAKVGAALTDHIELIKSLLDGNACDTQVKEHLRTLHRDALTLIEDTTRKRSNITDLQPPLPIKTRLRRFWSRITSPLKRK